MVAIGGNENSSKWRSLLLCLLLWFATIAADSQQPVTSMDPHIEVVGLFKNSAVLNIHGKQRILKVGGASIAGVILISADSDAAIVEVDGQRKMLYLSESVSGKFRPPEQKHVSILLNKQRQYLTTGSINDVPVTFLVDTGATLMAMNTEIAKTLQIDYSEAQVGEAVTAGGMVKTWRVYLASVKVGEIERKNVETAVLDGEYPKQVLLGMTFLRDVSLKESDGVLVLSSGF